jgi:hypothetical protein
MLEEASRSPSKSLERTVLQSGGREVKQGVNPQDEEAVLQPALPLQQQEEATALQGERLGVLLPHLQIAAQHVLREIEVEDVALRLLLEEELHRQQAESREDVNRIARMGDTTDGLPQNGTSMRRTTPTRGRARSPPRRRTRDARTTCAETRLVATGRETTTTPTARATTATRSTIPAQDLAAQPKTAGREKMLEEVALKPRQMTEEDKKSETDKVEDLIEKTARLTIDIDRNPTGGDRTRESSSIGGNKVATATGARPRTTAGHVATNVKEDEDAAMSKQAREEKIGNTDEIENSKSNAKKKNGREKKEETISGSQDRQVEETPETESAEATLGSAATQANTTSDNGSMAQQEASEDEEKTILNGPIGS